MLESEHTNHTAFPDGNYFFVTSKFGESFGGLTSSMFQRGRLFGQYANVHSTVVTFNYNPNYGSVIDNLRDRKIMSNSIHFINLYDYFRRESVQYEKKENKVEEEGLVYHQQGTNIYRFFYNGLYKKYKRFDQEGNLKVVHHFNENRYRYKTDEYDNMGYIHRTHYYDLFSPDIVRQTIFYRKNGSAYMTKWFKLVDNENQVERIQIYDQSGEIITVLDSDLQMQHYFLDILTNNEEKNFIISEARAADPIIMSYKNKHAFKIFMTHDVHLEKPRNFDSPLLKENKEVFENIDKPDAIVILTNKQKSDIVSRYGEKSNFFLIPHAYKDAPQLNDETIPKDMKKAVLIGRLAPQKQIDHAILAFSKVLETLPDVKLEIYGTGKDEEKLTKLIKKKKVQKNVRLMGFTNNPSNVYKSAAFSVLSSDHEGFGLVILESLSVGCPVISYDLKYGPSDMIIDGTNGFLVKDKDIDALAEKIIYAFDNPVLIEEMSKHASEVTSKFSEEHFIENWGKLFRQVSAKENLEK
ncbi:glycosyltransferase [Bacillus sp. USDA818B3_A]|uniref:glycosyltransferase n=1 Tax=Bacillus sp. USDA818B3_A TaxID=2698834 RepID=UPI00136F03CC|nr:glycosyltransferase [Bacillus sp. USDA818B3_A]